MARFQLFDPTTKMILMMILIIKMIRRTVVFKIPLQKGGNSRG